MLEIHGIKVVYNRLVLDIPSVVFKNGLSIIKG